MQHNQKFQGFRVKKSVVAMSAVLLVTGSFINVNAQQQQSEPQLMALEEIVVTARRRDETVQDVPLTVNAVTSEQLSELNVRKLSDLQGVVAGLTLEENAIAPNASLRGVRFDAFASGNNPTVAFYINDAPASSSVAMQALFDVGQIEVLRGPQGTLRGLAAPSGSITITTQRPDLAEFGGYIDTTLTDNGSTNVQGAVNVPIVEDMLALRFAAFGEKNDTGEIDSLNSSDSSGYEGNGWRGSLRYEPTDNFSINLMHQQLNPDRTDLSQVESANIANPSLPASPVFIQAKDRLAVTDFASTADAESKRTNLEVAFEFSDQQLNYVYSRTRGLNIRKNADDDGNFFGPEYTQPELAYLGQELESHGKGETHELRLSSTEPLFDLVDYVIGSLSSEGDNISYVTAQTPIFVFFPSPQTFATVNNSFIVPDQEDKEVSFFANLTFHLGEATELSVGTRYIEFENEGTVTLLPDTVFQDVENEWNETLYSISLKHDFNDDLMAYVSAGSSWRPGLNVIGNFNIFPSAVETNFDNLQPETSDSIELGVKAKMMDDRLQINAAIFHQEFDNYPYRGGSIFYAKTDFGGFDPNTGAPVFVPNVGAHNFVAAVPAEVDGIEIETSFQATEQLVVGALFSYAEGELDGTIACNDYLPHDGVPDSAGVPTLADIINAVGADNVATCNAQLRANTAPLWTTTLNAEYRFPIADMEGYVRGLWTLYGKSKNDPTNTIDDVDAYNILNLYAGMRSVEGTWEVMLYGKNIAETEEVTSRNSSPARIGYQALVSFDPPSTVGGSGVSTYRTITMTPPREFGINLRYNF